MTVLLYLASPSSRCEASLQFKPELVIGFHRSSPAALSRVSAPRNSDAMNSFKKETSGASSLTDTSMFDFVIDVFRTVCDGHKCSSMHQRVYSSFARFAPNWDNKYKTYRFERAQSPAKIPFSVRPFLEYTCFAKLVAVKHQRKSVEVLGDRCVGKKGSSGFRWNTSSTQGIGGVIGIKHGNIVHAQVTSSIVASWVTQVGHCNVRIVWRSKTK